MTLDLHGDIAVIRLDNPPVNGLGHAVRTAIFEGVAAVQGDPAVKAVVLVGAGKVFSAGADIREFGTERARAEPTLASVVRAVEDSVKPVVAAIHGVAMGGGLELALGCHFRVAAADAKVALPEVKLGLLPGCGGTQRLPRLVGVEKALEMMLSGEPVPVRSLASTALFDRIVEGDVLAAAIAFVREALAEGRPARRLRDLPLQLADADAFFAAARERAAAKSKHLPAPAAIVDAVEAAVKRDFESGLRQERESFFRLMDSPESRALRHAFFAERAAAKIPDVPEDTPTRTIRKAAVIGAGTMGGGIAMTFANAGIPVTVLEMKPEALERGMGVVRRNYESSVKRGRLTPEKLAERMGLIQGALEYGDLREADVIVEAVFEDMATKEAVFRRLDEVAKPGAILATNTSTLDVDRIAAFTRRPGDVVGMHFFSPANVMKLLEVVRGAKTSKDVLATVMALARRIGKTAVVSGVCDGFIGNRMLARYISQAGYLIEEGALPQQVDRALEAWGMAMGPFRVGDLAGNDIGWAVRKRRYAENPDYQFPKIYDRLCELGRFGQKTGAGWYRYEEGRREPIPDPVVEKLVLDYSREAGIARREIGEDEIVHRCIYALVNEGARIVEEGIALRASDVDLVYLTGYGFPAHRGGPMHYAGEQGLGNVIAAMRRFARVAHRDPAFWEPAPLLVRLAAEDRKFT